MPSRLVGFLNAVFSLELPRLAICSVSGLKLACWTVQGLLQGPLDDVMRHDRHLCKAHSLLSISPQIGLLDDPWPAVRPSGRRRQT